MKKASAVVALVLVLGIGSAFLTLGPALAQINTDPGKSSDKTGTSSTNVTSSSNTTQTAQDTMDTFSANGRIGSLIFDTGTSIAQSTTNDTTTSSSGNMSGLGGMSDNSTSPDNSTGTDTASTNNTLESDATAGDMTASSAMNTTSSNQTSMTTGNTTIAEELEPPYILVGDWDLAVTDGNVTDFSAGFDMVHIDGTERHTHNLTNLQANNATTVQLVEDGTTFITGTADLMKDGESMETGVNVIITIERLNATSIAIQSDHFEGQPVYGVVDSITDGDGLQIVGTSISQTRDATQNALNDTGDALADFGDQVADFFNGTNSQ